MPRACDAVSRATIGPRCGTTSIKATLRSTSAYARVRRQFGIPVGIMEGVAEPLGEMVKRAYMYESARRLTASMVASTAEAVGGSRCSVGSSSSKTS